MLVLLSASSLSFAPAAPVAQGNAVAASQPTMSAENFKVRPAHRRRRWEQL